MSLQSPPKPIKTAYAETNLNLNNNYDYLAKIADAVNDIDTAQQSASEYSFTPVQIGTFGDTPVWRVAFKVTFKEDMTETDYGTMLSDGVFNVPFSDYITSYNNVFLLGAFAVYRTDLTESLYDDKILDIQTASSPIPAFVLLEDMPEWSSLDGNGIYGHITFATPASNIKQD